jgi:hypothetical protein
MDLPYEEACRLLEECTVRLVLGTTSGTGFWVAPGLILTCSHVVDTAVSEPSLIKVYSRTYPDGPAAAEPRVSTVAEDTDLFNARPFAVEATMLAGGDLDLALLKVPAPPPAHVCAWLEDDLVHGDTLFTFGYPATSPAGDSVTFEYEGRSFSHDRLRVKVKGGGVDSGQSGSPTLNRRTRGVCGVVSIALDPQISFGGRLVPITQALERWPELGLAHRKEATDHRDWFDLLPLSLWLKDQAGRAESLRTLELDGREQVVPSPLTFPWQFFSTAPPWHEKMRRTLADTADRLKDLTLGEACIAPFVTLRLQENYQAILAELKKLPFEQTREEIKQQEAHACERLSLLSASSATSGDPAAEEELLELKRRRDKFVPAARHALQSLERSLQSPAYAKCLLVMSRLGGGKSHFGLSLLATTGLTPAGDWPDALFLRVDGRMAAQQGWTEYLLGEIRQATQAPFNSLEEFDRLLQAPRKRSLGLIVDDLQELLLWNDGFLKNLATFIENSTHIHSLRWILAIDENKYPMVTRFNSFWSRYAFLREGMEEAGGWIRLDGLNQAFSIGYRILEAEISKTKEAKTVEALAAMPGPTRAQLASPALAWSLLEVRDRWPKGALVNLNFLEFVEAFWSRRLAQLAQTAPEGLSDLELKQTLRLLARQFLAPTDALAVPELCRNLSQAAGSASNLSDPKVAKAAVESLFAGGLLRRVTDKHEDLGEVARAFLGFPFFWQWILARELLAYCEAPRRDVEKSINLLRQWLLQSPGNLVDRDGVLEFMLLLLESDDPAPDGIVYRNAIWDLIARELPSAAVWFAAPKARPDIQSALLGWLVDDPHRVGPKEDGAKFAFLYFLNEAPSKLVDVPTRLRLLQPHYEVFATLGVAPYFLYFAKRSVSRVSSVEELVEALVLFHGCEAMNVHEEAEHQGRADTTAKLALIAVSQLVQIQPEATQVVQGVQSYLRMAATLNPLTRKGKSECYFFREWITYHMCDWLVEKLGERAFPILYDCGWYRGAAGVVSYPIDLEMKMAANLSFGFWYRRQHVDRIAYRQIVEDLAESDNWRDHEIAFYLIKHTVASAARDRIEDGLRPALSQVLENPKLKTVALRERKFIERNCSRDFVDRLFRQPLGQSRRWRSRRDR